MYNAIAGQLATHVNKLSQRLYAWICKICTQIGSLTYILEGLSSRTLFMDGSLHHQGPEATLDEACLLPFLEDILSAR